MQYIKILLYLKNDFIDCVNGQFSEEVENEGKNI